MVYLVRHGRTALNAEGRFRGHLDPPLDEEGRREAKAVGRLLLLRPPTHVHSSPLRRAQETAEAIAQITGAPISTWEDLIDLDYGEWGRSFARRGRPTRSGRHKHLPGRS
jgi:broad specificity phosphatase PhoE